MKTENILSVGGFVFRNEEDASLARIEEQKIKYLEARMDYSNPESIHYVYEKAIQEKLFRSPIGLNYMKRLQEFLLSRPEISPETVTEIPLNAVFEEKSKVRRTKEKTGAQMAKEERLKSRFAISVMLNILLAFAIAAMFFISFNSEQPNVFNYERAIVNKYASWEEELTEREQVIREKERELKINQ